MIRAWLERHGWTWVREEGEDDLYTKCNPVCMNTAAALFSELVDADAANRASSETIQMLGESITHARAALFEQQCYTLRLQQQVARLEAAIDG